MFKLLEWVWDMVTTPFKWVCEKVTSLFVIKPTVSTSEIISAGKESVEIGKSSLMNVGQKVTDVVEDVILEPVSEWSVDNVVCYSVIVFTLLMVLLWFLSGGVVLPALVGYFGYQATQQTVSKSKVKNQVKGK